MRLERDKGVLLFASLYLPSNVVSGDLERKGGKRELHASKKNDDICLLYLLHSYFLDGVLAMHFSSKNTCFNFVIPNAHITFFGSY